MIEYRAVVCAIAGSRDRVLAKFRALGGNPSRWRRRDQEAMAEALSRTEDELELGNPMQRAAGIKLRQIRRALEDELWP